MRHHYSIRGRLRQPPERRNTRHVTTSVTNLTPTRHSYNVSKNPPIQTAATLLIQTFLIYILFLSASPAMDLLNFTDPWSSLATPPHSPFLPPTSPVSQTFPSHSQQSPWLPSNTLPQYPHFLHSSHPLAPTTDTSLPFRTNILTSPTPATRSISDIMTPTSLTSQTSKESWSSLTS